MRTMPCRLWIAVMLAGAMSVRSLGAGPATTRQDVESLIASLSSDNGTERQRAQDRLVELGTTSREVEGRLGRLARESRDEEVAARAQAALRIIAEGRTVGPSLVTLHLSNAEPREAFAQIARQAGVEIGPEPPDMWVKKNTPAVTLDAEARPFWETFREVCRQANVEPDFGDNGRLKVIQSPDGKWAASPAVVRGPLLIQAERITETRALDFGAPANGEQSREMTVNVFTEPKIRVLRDGFAASIDVARDDKGRSLLPDDGSDDIELTNVSNTTREWELTITLTCPAAGGTAKQISLLKGRLRLLVPVKVQTIEVPDVLTATEFHAAAAGRRLILHRARKVKGGYEAQVTLFRDNLTDAEWQQFASPQDFLRLVDSKNQPILFTTISETEGNEKQARLTLQFENPNNMPNGIGGPVGKPAKLVWEVPVESREVKVPFEFKDLKLP